MLKQCRRTIKAGQAEMLNVCDCWLPQHDQPPRYTHRAPPKNTPFTCYDKTMQRTRATCIAQLLEEKKALPFVKHAATLPKL